MSGDLPPPDPSHRNRDYSEQPYPGEPASYDRLRRVLVAVGGLAMVVFAIGLGFVVLRDTGDETRPGVAGTAPPPETEPAPETTERPAPATTQAVPASSAAPAVSAAPSVATTVPTTVRVTVAPTTTVPRTTVPRTTTVAPTTASSAPPSLTPAPDPAANAVATAQALLDAFADGRWNDARTLNPGRNESDAFLQTAYGPIVRAKVIPASVTPVNGGRYDMRIGIVSHEDQPAGQQTVLMCSHWQVDVASRTIQRLDSARLRVEGGFVDPNVRATELSSVCASLPLD